jgi:hypothetical protein
MTFHFMPYNFARIHKTLRVTPAIEARVADRVWSLEEIARLTDASKTVDSLLVTVLWAVDNGYWGDIFALERPFGLSLGQIARQDLDSSPVLQATPG